ncbi:MAG: argininosuccinate synthase [Thermodesulfobacteriota bacterium]
MAEKVKKIVLAYSGGLDTSVILRWLKVTYRCPVTAFVANIGQTEDWEAIRKKAIDTGADRVYIDDLRDTFVRDYVFPAFRANVVYESGYLLGTSLARPLIARRQVEIAGKEKANAVSHGATGKGNDQVRFELSYMAIDPGLIIIAPWREWDFKGRQDLIKFARKHGIPVPTTKKKPYSCDCNLLHISYEGGILEDPWREPPQDMFTLTRSPERAPSKPTYIEIDFAKGDPVAIDGSAMQPVDLLTKLNEIGGLNGIGRADIVENRFVGMKSRGVYETPGGTIMRIAHQALESITMDREVMHIRDSLIPRYAEMIYYGFWFSPEMRLLQKTMDETQTTVTGTVRLKLYKGNCTVVGRKSDQSLYIQELATFEEDDIYRQKDAEGFIRLNGLRLKVQALQKKRRS